MGSSGVRAGMARNAIVLISLLTATASVSAANGLPADGQAAGDVLMSYDLWGNPTPVGGVTNGGTTAHSTW